MFFNGFGQRFFTSLIFTHSGRGNYAISNVIRDFDLTYKNQQIAAKSLLSAKLNNEFIFFLTLKNIINAASTKVLK